MSIKKIIEANEALLRAYKNTTTLVGGLSVRFFKDRFIRQLWIDDKIEKWKKRKRPDKGKYAERAGNRAILTKTGRLRRSIRVIKKTADSVVIGTDVPYAEAHNEGLSTTVTQQVPAAKVRSFKRNRKGRSEIVQAHNRKAHSRKMKINLPQRRFIGDSKFLNRRIEKNIEQLILKELKK
ncbi:MAG: phage virion morphogenesis protein [Microscillaceae bacterium]|nr:phage virion morphogenesis protein [Microscillaceae bacterium]